MQIPTALETVMWWSFLVVFLFYLGYFFVLYFYTKKRQGKKSLNFYFPTVSMVIPVYNEAKTIAKKLQNIEELTYPRSKMEVVFVDGHSLDNTAEIIKNQARKSEKDIKLLEQDEREGYTRGMIEGILNSQGAIIVATDAASFHKPDAIKHLVKHFKNPEVGAVTGKEVVFADTRNLGPQLEESYRVFYDFMREAETEIDSTPDSKGEILAVRRDICKKLIPKLELSPNASFDSCVPFQAKMMGYRTIFDPQAQYHEYAPTSFMDRMKQQIRRATVLVGALFLFKEMLLQRKYDKFGLVILPVHFVMQCILPWIFLLGVGCLLILTFLNPIKTFLPWIIAAVAVAANRKSRLFLISFIQSQVALVAGIFRLATRKESLLIETIPSTRIQ